jgi:hypothetical protein
VAGRAGPIEFTDQTEAVGLLDPLAGMYGHAAAWGDLDSDGQLDLFVGTFADREAGAYQYRGATGPSPDRLLQQAEGTFTAVPLDEMFTRTSGAIFADMDGDADIDLVLSRNWHEDAASAAGTMVVRNDGGALTTVEVAGLPSEFGGRSIGVLDYNADGNVDLFIAEDRWTGGRSVLLRNEGSLTFSDATTEAGIATDAYGLGVAVADLTGDGHRDIFVSGSNRLFVAKGDSTFVEAAGAIPQWEVFGEEDDVAGVSVADVNRDGLLDLVVGQHYNSTVDFGELVPIRLYLNRGSDSGVPVFEDVTEAAGLVGLPTKAPHVEISDVDNDGWPDLVTTASVSDGSRPAIFRHLGLDGEIPHFEPPSDLGGAQYWVAGPTADVDRDGRLDMLLVEWEPSLPSLYLHNESDSGHWLEVSVSNEVGGGIGWRVEVYGAGAVGETDSLLGAREITVTDGYSSGVAPVAHFGLGQVTEVDVRLVPPGGVASEDLIGIGADQHIRFPGGCG